MLVYSLSKMETQGETGRLMVMAKEDRDTTGDKKKLQFLATIRRYSDDRKDRNYRREVDRMRKNRLPPKIYGNDVRKVGRGGGSVFAKAGCRRKDECISGLRILDM